MRILVVEDEEKMAQVVKHALEESGYIVDLASDGLEGKAKSDEVQYDLFIVDVMLPHESGLSFCRKIRENDSSVPILVLSALDATEDSVLGLEAGADDYLSKPFKLIELLARIRALFRRASNIKNGNVLNCSDLELDLQSHLAKRSGNFIQLTMKEFTLLEFLMRNKGRVLTRAQISERGWERPYDLSDNNVDVYINMLRKKIDKGYNPKLIQTVVGMGYVMREPHV